MIRMSKVIKMGDRMEEKSRYREIIFEPDFEFTDEEMEYIEEQMVDTVKEKLGDEYKVADWKLDMKLIVFAERKGEE